MFLYVYVPYHWVGHCNGWFILEFNDNPLYTTKNDSENENIVFLLINYNIFSDYRESYIN